MSLRRFAQTVAGWLLPDPDREFILGDLDELYRKWRRDDGRAVAAGRYLGALFASARAQRTRRPAGLGQTRAAGGSGGRPVAPRGGLGRSGGRPGAPRGGLGGAFGSLTQDVRFGLRSLRRDPVFTVAAVTCLALGIGANTAIFSVANGVLLEPLPYAAPEELVVLNEYSLERGAPSRSDPNVMVSYQNALDWRDGAETLQDLALAGNSRYLVLDADVPEHVRGAFVTSNYFDLLGAPAALGRTLVPGDRDAVTVLSDRMWRRNFGARPEVLGRSIRLNGEAFEIVGVMPPDFTLPFTSEELWVPIAAAPRDFVVASTELRERRAVRAIARLARGATLAEAESEMEVIAERLRGEYPEANQERGLQVVPLHENRVGRVRPTLLMLFGAVGLLLLIACANVANLLLARITARQGEVAIRSALGAGRWRIARQLLTESSLLSLAGGALGFLNALWAVRLIKATSPGDIPRLQEVGLDLRVLVFTFLTSLAVGWVFGLAPAVQAARSRTSGVLQRRSMLHGGTAPGAWLRSVLVVAEVAAALVVMLGAGLLISSFRYLWTFEPGFDPRGVLTVDIPLERSTYPDRVQADAFFQNLYERLRGLPSVESVGGVEQLPGTPALMRIRVTPPERADPADLLHLPFRRVSGDFFTTLRIPLLAGRLFRDDEDDVVVINEALAEQFWPDGAAVGEDLTIPDYGSPQVVGIIGNQRFHGTDPVPRPEMFFPYPSMPGGRWGLVVVVRTTGDPLQLAGTVREHITALDPEQPIAGIRTLEQALGDTMARPRFYMALFSLFGGVALALSAVGIFGVASYSVTRRTHEVGVRIALGAERRHVLRLIVGRGALLTAAGVIIGLGIARALTRYVESLLYGVAPNDPVTFVTVPMVLMAAAVLAFWLPARRAARVDPVVALRGD